MPYFDTNLFLIVNHFAERTSYLHGLFFLIAQYGIGAFVMFWAIGWYLAWQSSDLGKMTRLVWAGMAGLVALALNQPLVSLFHEPRPYTSLSHILVLAHRTTDYSFPSDHATFASAVTVGLFLVDPLIGIISLLFSLVLIFTRVYIAAHYPHDVVVGLLVGAVVSIIGYLLVRKPLQAVIGRLAKTPLKPLLMSKDMPHDA